MNTGRTFQRCFWSCGHMNSAVQAAVLGAEFDGPRDLARWGRRVKEAFFSQDSESPERVEFFLETVDRAVREILFSEHRDLLLADALAHPAKFVQTVLLMMMMETSDQKRAGDAGWFAEGETLR